MIKKQGFILRLYIILPRYLDGSNKRDLRDLYIEVEILRLKDIG